MKIALAAVVIGSAFAPAAGFSYLESLNKANPVMAKPVGGAGKSNGSSYLDAISSPVAPAVRGAGITSYLDALPKATTAPQGSGMASYASSLNAPKPASSPAPAPASYSSPAPAPAAPVRAASSSSSGVGAASSGTYLSTLVSSSSSAPTGSGVRGYLDILPRAPSTSGAGFRTYTDNLKTPSSSVISGAGFRTYVDVLSGTAPERISSSLTGSGAKISAGKDIGFTLEASDLAGLISQMKGGVSGQISLSGIIDKISFK